MIPICKGNKDARSCENYTSVKLLEHGMKVMEMIFEKRPKNVVKLDDLQMGLCLKVKLLMQFLYYADVKRNMKWLEGNCMLCLLI